MTHSRDVRTPASGAVTHNGLSAPGPGLTGRRIVIGLAVLAAVIAAVVVGRQLLGGAGKPPVAPPVAVMLGAAKAEDVAIYVTGIGTVQASNTVTVKVRVDGEIKQVNFTEGQDVKQGEVLAQIDPRPFQAQLGIAEAALARDQATLANAKRDLDRSLGLVDGGFASRQTVDTRRAQVAQLEAAVRGDQAQVDTVKLQLGYANVVAPIAGRTGVRLLDQGNIVRASDNTGLVVITQLEPVSVIFTLPQEALDRVTAAQKASGDALTVLAYGREDAVTPRAEGKLLLVNNQIDPASGTVQLKATFANADHKLWPGQFVNVRLLLDVRDGAVTVPASVVMNGPNGPIAYAVKPDQTAEIRQLKVEQVRDGVALVTSGLAAGDTVVTEGQFKLRPGVRVVEQKRDAAGTAVSGGKPADAPKGAP